MMPAAEKSSDLFYILNKNVRRKKIFIEEFNEFVKTINKNSNGTYQPRLFIGHLLCTGPVFGNTFMVISNCVVQEIPGSSVLGIDGKNVFEHIN